MCQIFMTNEENVSIWVEFVYRDGMSMDDQFKISHLYVLKHFVTCKKRFACHIILALILLSWHVVHEYKLLWGLHFLDQASVLPTVPQAALRKWGPYQMSDSIYWGTGWAWFHELALSVPQEDFGDDAQIATSLLGELKDEFDVFVSEQCTKDETFLFWNNFLHRDCIAYFGLYIAILSGNWHLRNFSIKEIFPLFHGACPSSFYVDLIPRCIRVHFAKGGWVANVAGNHELVTLITCILNHKYLIHLPPQSMKRSTWWGRVKL